MYLKALEIQGFKSFPEKTVLTFDKEITAIVGPNGSGKSNISDAMLWVMGEQRSKALRGGKMEDVIFGGTEKRSPMGFAQVSLILDNSKGLFSIDAPEVVITRRYYRSGESEYYLNRENVRLKDINELLMDTGLGRDGYSIIGQGRISEIVSAKSTDRREIFEEAAGISRYRYRKEEAERKLERTEDNLLRINDKIDELELQVTPLQKQAETAKRFLVLRDEQRSLEISTWMETLDRLHAQAETVNSEYDKAKAGLDSAQAELEKIYTSSENLSEKMRECDVEAEKLRGTLSASEAVTAELESAAAVLRANLSHNAESVERLKTEIDEQSGRTDSIRAQVEEHRARIAGIDMELAEKEAQRRLLQEEMVTLAARSDESQRGLGDLVSAENEEKDALTKCVTTLSLLEDKRADLEKRGGGIDEDMKAAEQKLSEVSASLAKAQKEFDKNREHCDELNNVINGHKMLMGSRETAVKELREKMNRLTVDRRSAEARVNMLAEMEKEYEGLGKAVKTVMRESGRGSIRGVHGPVASLISTQDKYALAIETALGSAMQNIVVDTQAAAKAAIELLKRSDGGRATFRPIETVKPKKLANPPRGDEGYVGIASELVTNDSRYDGIISDLLGRTVVAETLSDAVRMSKSSGYQLRIVTLDGQLINAGGSMTGGSVAKNVGILSRANELKKLRSRLESLGAEEKSCAAELAEAERVLEAARYEMSLAGEEQNAASEELHRSETELSQYKLMRDTLNGALDDLDEERSGLAANISENARRIEDIKAESARREKALEELRSKIAEASSGREDFDRRREELSGAIAANQAECASLQTEREASARSAESLDGLARAIAGDSEQRRAGIDALLREADSIKAEIAEKQGRIDESNARSAQIRDSISATNELKLSLEGRRVKADKLGQDKNREILDMQSVCARFEQRKLSAEMEEKQIVDKLWDNYELSRSAAQELRQSVENMTQANKRIAELKREIGRLGPVNVGAIEDYARVSERYEFLTGQRDDVAKAKRDLLKIISDITGEMKEIFIREFRAIDECFRKVFLELFGGGKAALELEDEEDPLGCGIDIKVQPPGKAVTTISLLSGGEKSFVAIALYFAIMKVRPTPFCIMDEIDAALDEANVERYAGYMRGMTGDTQFIVITHHRATMEEADVLYGVTMQEKGVTTVLSVDLDEAEKTIA